MQCIVLHVDIFQQINVFVGNIVVTMYSSIEDLMVGKNNLCI